jgi:RNA polymerase sigma-70 factor (ECF subfamily)
LHLAFNVQSPREDKAVPDTSVTLLERLRSHSDTTSWQRLMDLYEPLIQGWLRKQGLQPSDADDLAQEVLVVLVRELPHFKHQRPGAFRAWLRIITINRLRDFCRARQNRPAATGDSGMLRRLDQLEDPHSELSRLWEQEHDQYIVQRALELIEPEFSPTTWRAFWRVTRDGLDADAVAAELGVTTNAVFIAKSRVLKRLRNEVEGLID